MPRNILVNNEQVTVGTVEDAVSYYTKQAGDISRQLGLAGIGVIWVFRVTSGQPPLPGEIGAIPHIFRCPLLLIVISLGLDALQYIIGSIVWAIPYFGWKGGAASDVITNRKGRDGTLLVIVVVKLVIMGIAYIFLICALLSTPMLWGK